MDLHGDDAFVTQFERCGIPNDRFRHADHIRLAWIYIRRYGYADAEARVRRGIRRLASHSGAPEKYHDTLTVAWMRLVALAFGVSSRLESFAEFARAHAWLLDKRAVLEFYSRDRLMSEAARAGWVDPDLKPLPVQYPPRHEGSPP